jgi:B12-binding domain/radical SAM domain protein
MSLRVVAVAAPAYSQGSIGKQTLTSQDPASLYNACRMAAFYAEKKIGAWGDSNWADGRKERQRAVLLMHSWFNDVAEYESLLESVKPNLVLIGAMTLCLPGAILCAKLAKERFKDSVCTVLGGRHVFETLFINRQSGAVMNHVSSPVTLMSEGRIDQVFDVVVSGEGEFVIASIGELIEVLERQGVSAASVAHHLDRLAGTPGKWIISAKGDVISSQANFDHNLVPAPCEMFGVRTRFEVFDDLPTAHVYSDSGSGCMHDCSFCSECASVNGPILQIETSAERLFRQLKSAAKVIHEDYGDLRPNAFVEDSILLAARPQSFQRLVELLSSQNLGIHFGGQLTFDLALKYKTYLTLLREAGLRYVFFGLETKDPEKVGGMSKNVAFTPGSWLTRAEEAVALVHSLFMKCGVSLLFGLGESRKDREELFTKLSDWRRQYASLASVSMNWAVQHPLRGKDGNANYRYLEWGTSDPQLIDAFQDFGEASEHYSMAGVSPPTLDEVEEVRLMYRSLFAT